MTRKIRDRNQGSIWKREDRFRAAVSLHNGKRITKTFDKKTAAQLWLHEMLVKNEKGNVLFSSKVTLEMYLTEWLSIHKTQVKPKTAHRYEQIARDYVFPHLGKIKLLEINVFTIEELYQTLLRDGISVRNVRYVHALLHRSFKDAVKRGLVAVNPAHGARQPKGETNEMAIWDERQVMQFLIAARGQRYEALYHMAVKTGMRQGELLGLKWIDLDCIKGHIRVQRQVQRITGQGMVFLPPKTKAGRRIIPLGNEMLRILREHKSKQDIDKMVAGKRWQDNNLIFPTIIGTPNSPTNLLKVYKILQESAGVSKIRFHDLRHTAASIMLNRGVPIFAVSRILGHSKPSTTMDIYGHLIPVMHKEIGNQMDEWLTPIPVEIGDNADIITIGEYIEL